MHITFYGAAREVTGSMFMLAANTEHILLDCGMFQGSRKESNEKNRIIPFDPEIVTSIAVSHAHIDHSGRLPLLTQKGFRGRIVCTRQTADALKYLLADSAHIQESDADYLNYKHIRGVLAEVHKSAGARTVSKSKMREIKQMLKKNRHRIDSDALARYARQFRLDVVEPLYTMEDAEDALKQIDGYPYQHSITIGRDIILKQYEAGHILGSAMNLVKVKRPDRTMNILHSGDLGRFDKPIINDPCLEFDEEDREIDLLLLESTYGDRVHEQTDQLQVRLEETLQHAFDQGGTVLIPAFAFGRTQTLLYFLHQLYDENLVPRVPVYVDSPLATRLTQVFGEHPEVYDDDTHRVFLEKGENPFLFRQMHFVRSLEESIQLNKQQKPQIIIAASGMCEGGRITHHLRYKMHDPTNTILLVGYMAQHTLGRRIEEEGLAYHAARRMGPPPRLRMLGKDYTLEAKVEKIEGFSGHADKTEILRFLKKSNLRVKRIALVHGEESQQLPFAELLRSEGYEVHIPRRGEVMQVM